MRNLKSIITGILSGAVFFMAVQVGVAQEILASDKGNVAAKDLAGLAVFAGTVKQLSAEWARDKMLLNNKKIEVAKAPIDRKIESDAIKAEVAVRPPLNIRQNIEWYYHGPDDNTTQYTVIDNWVSELDEGEPAGGCGDSGIIPCTLLGPENPGEFEEFLEQLGPGGVESEATAHRNPQ